MKARDYTPLLARLEEEYARRSPHSRELGERARHSMVDGGSHPLRLIEPFPPRIAMARGAYVTDEDGHEILDLWQGHYANVLGHNPPLITAALAQALQQGYALQAGFTDRLQIEVAEILCRQCGAERVRFTTSGALATMNAIMLSRAFTARPLILKVGGGWHGGHAWGLQGTSFSPADGFRHAESAGLPGSAAGEVLQVRFNDPDDLRARFREHGDRTACFILELVQGNGGGMAASPEYVAVARELTQDYGALLIFDEVITGFRYRAGDAGALYGVRPDLATFGKVIGGGMPLAAVAGRADVLGLAGRAGGSRVRFAGGTYSGHPATMIAARTMLAHLTAEEAAVYPRLSALGDAARREASQAFAGAGIHVLCTGDGNAALPSGSLFQVHFPYQEDRRIERPEDALDPAVCDVALANRVLALIMLLEDVHVVHGGGALSTAHSDADVARLGEAFARAAELVKAYL